MAQKEIQAVIKAWNPTCCDKCGEEVEKNDDALLLNVIIDIQEGGKNTFSHLSVSSRHLLPTQKCEGSPSRAQYLKGQPRDTRPGFVSQFSPEFGKKVRRAYKLMDL